MKKSTVILTLILGLIWSCAYSQNTSFTYAIQNVKSGKNLRPYEAISTDGNKIVLYDNVEWKCMTWQFFKEGGNTFQLRNLFTSKTFEPATQDIKAGTGLVQEPLSRNSSKQQWEFIEVTKDIYNIRLKGTEFYISQFDGNGKTNSPIVLNKLTNSENQQWKLVKQNPKQ